MFLNPPSPPTAAPRVETLQNMSEYLEPSAPDSSINHSDEHQHYTTQQDEQQLKNEKASQPTADSSPASTLEVGVAYTAAIFGGLGIYMFVALLE